MAHGISRRGALIAGTAILAAPMVARAQPARLRFTLDWAFQAPNAFALLARDKGYFRDAGIDVQIDR
ncbi:MAG: ABC transporter substrate-binding protein, partial [Alphaproteobacteria bacterium]